MSESGYDAATAPTRRGSKNPELARRLLDDNLLADVADADDNQATVYEGLSAGAMVVSKFTRQIEVEGQPAWATYGATDHILPDESADDAFRRLVAHTVEGIFNSTETIRSVIEQEAEEQRAAQRTTRIVPTRRSAASD